MSEKTCTNRYICTGTDPDRLQFCHCTGRDILMNAVTSGVGLLRMSEDEPASLRNSWQGFMYFMSMPLSVLQYHVHAGYYNSLLNCYYILCEYGNAAAPYIIGFRYRKHANGCKYVEPDRCFLEVYSAYPSDAYHRHLSKMISNPLISDGPYDLHFKKLIAKTGHDLQQYLLKDIIPDMIGFFVIE
jgi:hypothetical protein